MRQSDPLTEKKMPKIGKKREHLGKERKSGRNCKNWEGSFTLPLLTDRAGYATDLYVLATCSQVIIMKWEKISLSSETECFCMFHLQFISAYFTVWSVLLKACFLSYFQSYMTCSNGLSHLLQKLEKNKTKQQQQQKKKKNQTKITNKQTNIRTD